MKSCRFQDIVRMYVLSPYTLLDKQQLQDLLVKYGFMYTHKSIYSNPVTEKLDACYTCFRLVPSN